MDTHTNMRVAAFNFEGDDVIDSHFNALELEAGYRHCRKLNVKLPTDWAPALLERTGVRLERSLRWDTGETTLLFLGDGVALRAYVGRGGDACLWIAARDYGSADDLAARSKLELHRPQRDPDKVDVRLWTLGRSPSYTLRTLDAPEWEGLKHNYPGSVRDELGEVMRLPPRKLGGLALWYGPPGTGKTTAVRALARAWRAWCDVHVIVDPESLLNDPGYLMKVITTPFDEDGEESDRDSTDRARLIVLEDAGELIAADARQATGQALSRVLNVTDGLIGRGLNSSVLITTNEEIGRLHPAIRRPGRCWSQLRIGAFRGSEARAWLRRAEVPADSVTGERTLAELYAIARGDVVREERLPVGFGV